MTMIFRSLFGGKQSPASSSPAIDPIEVTGPADEEAFLDSVGCECAGPWASGERTVLSGRDRVEIFRRDVRCKVCGTGGTYVFAAPAGAYDVNEDDEGPRAHHYVFVHQVLPQIFFNDPDGFLHVTLGPSGHRRLADLWRVVGDRESPSAIIPASGLEIGDVAFDGRRGALIRFPEPQFSPEGHFAALLERSDGDEPRFFVLEKTRLPSRSGEAGEQAILCEWLEGGRRRNHDRIMPPDQVRFATEVGDQLAEERRRLAGGAPRSAASWDSAGKEDPLDLMFKENFRLHPCLFAFHLLPDALLRDGALPTDAGSSELEALIDRLWREASQLCAAAGERPLPPDDRPCAGFHQLGAGRFIVVEMPSAFSAPEPLYMAARATNADAIYLVESAGARPDQVFVASIDSGGQHSILGTVDEVNLSSFLEAFSGPDHRPKFSSLSTPNTLKQLIAYAAMAKRLEKLA
jgi:hypothetical protein